MNAKDRDRAEALNNLRATLAPGDTVWTVLHHTARSGMYRAIDVYVMQDHRPRRLTWTVSRALGCRYDRRHKALGVSGCGMDMGFHLVYELSAHLFPDGFGCVGEGCLSNDHSNGDRDYTPHVEDVARCAACGEPYPCSVQTNRKSYRPEAVAAHTVAPTKAHWHKDGGYALRQRWL